MRGSLDTPSGCGFLSGRRIPGVRKKRVPLANLLAPLRGAKRSEGQDSYLRLETPNVQTPEHGSAVRVPPQFALLVFGISGKMSPVNLKRLVGGERECGGYRRVLSL